MTFAVNIDEESLTISFVERKGPRQAQAASIIANCVSRIAMVMSRVRTVSGLMLAIRQNGDY